MYKISVCKLFSFDNGAVTKNFHLTDICSISDTGFASAIKIELRLKKIPLGPNDEIYYLQSFVY